MEIITDVVYLSAGDAVCGFDPISYNNSVENILTAVKYHILWKKLFNVDTVISKTLIMTLNVILIQAITDGKVYIGCALLKVLLTAGLSKYL